MMTAHKEVSSPKNIHRPILIKNLDNMTKTSGVEKCNLQKIVILRCDASLTKSVGMQKYS